MGRKDMDGEYYERFWKKELTGGNIFQGLPDWRNSLKKRVDFYEKMLKGKVLDAGCGEGDFSLHIAKLANVSRIESIDLSQTAITTCLVRAKERDVLNKVNFQVGSVSDLPFRKGTFDSIFAFEIVEHILDIEKMFQEFNRVLKKGGHLGITTSDFNLLKMVIISLFYFETYFDPISPHIRFFTKNTLIKMLEKNGFKLLEHQWDGNYLGLMPMGQKIIAQKERDN